MKKIPISMNDKEYGDALTLALRLGMTSDVYGWFPKTIKASIKFNILFLDLLASFIPVINEAEMEFLFQAVKTSVRIKNAGIELDMAQKEAQKYNPTIIKSMAELYQSNKLADKK